MAASTAFAAALQLTADGQTPALRVFPRVSKLAAEPVGLTHPPARKHAGTNRTRPGRGRGQIGGWAGCTCTAAGGSFEVAPWKCSA